MGTPNSLTSLDLRSHGHPQLLDLVGPGHHTTVVVGKHYHRDLLQIGLKHPFTGDIEIVAIHQGEKGMFHIYY